MCAVIGAIFRNPSAEDYNLIRRVFLESKIRGLHATGMSVLPWWSDLLQTFIEPVSADKFTALDNLEDCIANDGNLYMIGHCRYSTSDLQYNQPLYKVNKSIVHNGVITQELPEKWKDLYGYDCITKNDSELILHSEDPLREFSNMSMGVCELNSNKTIRFYRSGKRPLYFCTLTNGIIITSTADIAKRVGIDSLAVSIPVNTYLTIDSDLVLQFEDVKTNETKDYQYAL